MADVEVDLFEEILMHEIMVALIVRRGESDIFVKVKRGDLGEIQPFVPLHADQFLIKAERRAAGRKSEYHVGFLPQTVGNEPCGFLAHCVIILFHDDKHGCTPGWWYVKCRRRTECPPGERVCAAGLRR